MSELSKIYKPTLERERELRSRETLSIKCPTCQADPYQWCSYVWPMLVRPGTPLENLSPELQSKIKRVGTMTQRLHTMRASLADKQYANDRKHRARSHDEYARDRLESPEILRNYLIGDDKYFTYTTPSGYTNDDRWATRDEVVRFVETRHPEYDLSEILIYEVPERQNVTVTLSVDELRVLKWLSRQEAHKHAQGRHPYKNKAEQKRNERRWNDIAEMFKED